MGLTSGSISLNCVNTATSTTPGTPAVSGAATAKGNLATGSVGVSGTPSYAAGNGSTTTAEAYIKDNLMFDVAGAIPTTVTDIGVTFTVDGSLTYGNNSSVNTNDMLTLGGGAIVYLFGSGPPALNTISEDGGWVSNQILSESPTDFVFQATYALEGSGT